MAATYWMPQGEELSPDQALVLAVPALARPKPEEHWSLWRTRMEAMVLADQPGAALMVAQAPLVEKTLDLWLIVRNDPLPEAWRGLTGCESTQHLRRMIEWDRLSVQVEPPTQTLLQILAVLQV
jgi:hypothetical protein